MTVKGQTGRGERGEAHSCRGVALARVLVTVAVVAIVATVALPISMDHLDSTNTAQAVADLGAIEIAIARYKTQNRGALPSSLSELRVGGWQDPWGNPYRYVNLEAQGGAAARRDFSSNPLNRDYDLFSTGRDRRTASSLNSPLARDDIIRGLGGSFLGNASEYPGR